MIRSVSLMGSVFLLILLGCDNGKSGSPKGKAPQSQNQGAGPNKAGNKFVGTWSFVRSSTGRAPDWGTTLILEPDGQLTLRGPGYANAGTYKVDKKTLILQAAALSETLTLTKLTDSEMILELELPGTKPSFEYRKK